MSTTTNTTTRATRRTLTALALRGTDGIAERTDSGRSAGLGGTNVGTQAPGIGGVCCDATGAQLTQDELWKGHAGCISCGVLLPLSGVGCGCSS